MTEQQQSAEERAREIVVAKLYYPTCADYEYPEVFAEASDDVRGGYLDAADDILAALAAANLAIVDTAELAQLRADLDAAMAFAEAWLAVGKTPSDQEKPTLTNVLGMMKAGRCLDALAPALDRWRQGRQESDE